MLLEIRQLNKRFGSMYALHEFSLDIERGTVHGLVGENGAGKSTLIKILTGVYHKDSGEILMDGKPVHIQRPTDSQALGISVCHQDRNLVPSFNGVENVYLGRRGIRTAGGLMNFRAMKQEIEQVMEKYHISFPLDTLGRDLTPPQKTMLEITRAIMTDCKLLILDEPTAALTDKETEILFELIGRLKERGTAILYVSHRLDEIFRLTDCVSVMKNGELVGTVPTAGMTRDGLISMMTDNWVSKVPEKSLGGKGDVMLEAAHVATADGIVKDASFTAHRGEILGIFGLGGSGRTELLEALYGLRMIKDGTVKVRGETYVHASPRKSLAKGIVIINEDRRGKALVPSLSIRNNMALSTLGRYQGKLFYRERREAADVKEKIGELGIKTTGMNQPINELSGGNQQKVVFAKALMSKPEIFLCDEPTQAVDVKTREEIHDMLRKYAAGGSAVVFVTSDLREMLEVVDRIIIFSAGRTKEMMENENLSAEQVLKCCYADH